MNTAHTDGPWFVCLQDGDEKACTIFAEHQVENGRIHADVWDCYVAEAGINHKEFEANARLIAAAPELLEALQAVLLDVENLDNESCISADVGQKVRASIAKATGVTA